MNARNRVPRLNRRYLRTFFVMTILVVALGVNFLVTVIGLPTGTSVFSELRLMVPNLTASYDEKMYMRLGRYYELMKFVIDNTEVDSLVLIPSDLNRGGMTNYFLYPRTWGAYSVVFEWSVDSNGAYVLIDKALLSNVAGSVFDPDQIVAEGNDMVLVVFVGDDGTP